MNKFEINPTSDHRNPLQKYRFLEEAFSRNIGFFTPGEQERLHRTTVAIPGLGGVGGVHLVTLARAGIGRFHLADFDRFESVNVNRQHGARASTIGQSKIDMMSAEAMDINPFLEIQAFPEGIHSGNVDAFLNGVDVVVDGMDFFCPDVRRLFFNRALEKGIHVVTAGPLGFGTALLIFAPDRGMDFDTYFDIKDGMTQEEKLLAFFVGLAPKAAHRNYTLPGSISMSEKRGPSLGAGCQICASAAAAEVIRILLKKPGIRPAPHYFQYDPFSRKFHRGYLPWGNRNPIQRVKIRYLRSRLCGPTRYLGIRKPEVSSNPVPPGGDVSAEIFEYLIQAGIRAPSGDNCQPWRFAANENSVSIHPDRSADASFFNVNQAASLIACGAAAENMVLAASRFGLKGEVETSGDAASSNITATVKLTADGTREHPLQRFIWERHTNRTPYDKAPLDADHIHEIQEAVHGFAAAKLMLLTDPPEIREAARLVFQADRIRAGHRGLHEHLMRMIRFRLEEALEKRDGFPLKNLEAGVAGECFLRCTRSWRVMAVLNRLGLGNMISLVSYQGIRSASAVGLVKCKSIGAKHLIEGGRALERIWLTAERLGLSFQPMTAITLFRLRWQMGGEKDFQPAHRRMLNRLWPSYGRLFDVCSDAEGHVMLFRIGRGRPVSCRTLRKSLKNFEMEAAPTG